MNLESVRVSTLLMTRATTLPLRWTAPTTIALPCPPVPPKSPRPPLSLVLVLGLSADVGFVNFDVADQLLELRIAERNANLAAHEPRGFVGTKAHVAEDLQRAHALLLVSIRCMTRNQSRSGLFVFSKIVPTSTENR